MKRRQLLTFLWCVPILMLSCRDPKVPSTPTVITGKVVDETGKPLPGAGLQLYGIRKKGMSGYETFIIETKSDSDGNYTLSQIIPKDTDRVDTTPIGNDIISFSVTGYAAYFLIDGKSELASSAETIPRDKWGTTITLNYQFKKR